MVLRVCNEIKFGSDYLNGIIIQAMLRRVVNHGILKCIIHTMRPRETNARLDDPPNLW